MSDVDSLRAQLRERGYLTHGIERWFALDPWSSRAFWLELITVALKAATLIAAFAALPLTAIMAFRNQPLFPFETLGLFVSYAAASLAIAFAFVITIALILKVRPALPIDTPRALLAISLATGAVLVAPVALWWYRFETTPSLAELAVGGALSVVFFLTTTIVVSAALLSFFDLRTATRPGHPSEAARPSDGHRGDRAHHAALRALCRPRGCRSPRRWW